MGNRPLPSKGSASSRSEDDFERESKAEAAAYLLENRTKGGTRGRKPGRARISGAKDSAAHHMKPAGNERIVLDYDGQVQLGFNPLFRLAGLDSDGDDIEAAGGHSQSHGADERGPIVTREEEEEEKYSDEEFGPPEPRLATPHTAAGGEGEDEEVYSDEDISLATVNYPSNSSVPFIQPKLPNTFLDFDSLDGIPPVKPAFNVPPSLLPAAPYILNKHTKDIYVPAHLNQFLKQYQREGVQFLFDRYQAGWGGVLGDDMGLGKTVQVIAFLSAIMRKSASAAQDYGRRKRTLRQSGTGTISPQRWPTALIVCPKSLIGNWSRELDTWGYFEYEILGPDNSEKTRTALAKGYLDILLMSYDTMRGHINDVKDLPFTVLIADEAHRLKEPRSMTTVSIKKIQTRICFALTGTLVQNRIDEMWSVLDFAHRGWAGTSQEWIDFVVDPIKTGHQSEGTAQQVVEAIRRLGIMTTKVLPHFYLRRDKTLLSDILPRKTDLVVFCPLTGKQQKAYTNILACDEIARLKQLNAPCPCGSRKRSARCCQLAEEQDPAEVLFKFMTALSKVANHFGLLYPGMSSNEHVLLQNLLSLLVLITCQTKPRDADRYSDTDNCGKWKVLERLLTQWRAEPCKNKILLFSSSVRLLKMLAKLLRSSSLLSSFPVDMLTGEVDIEERMRMVDRFQDQRQDHFVLLISTKAGGVGLNLTAANKVVIFDPSWNPADDLQAMDRAFRIGQERPVDVYRLIALGTIEEAKYERQIHKQQNAKQFNDGTFEPRHFQGYDGASTLDAQGDLYGAHNLFRYEPNGFVAQNLKDGICDAGDAFLEEDHEDDQEGEDDTHEGSDRVKQGGSQQKKEGRSADEHAKALMEDVLGLSDNPVATGKVAKDILAELGLTSIVHDKAFQDSPEERHIYELGVNLLRDNPELAKTMKANELAPKRKKRPREIAGGNSHKVKDGGRQKLSEKAWKRPRGSNQTRIELSDEE
ncbi:hypothetical protein I350_06857 [Cryptococcus amylolentus CBS 6273]|uniref:Uncharacterized protein n=1 Tax=Cryptococcus amylolentus CBS 6273 TaxID=1296118 RepID=A0A1E3JH66_9TREE|nr:hypothetical protein I350_06857 [Cryptococcus amylolentus CBS 6273]